MTTTTDIKTTEIPKGNHQARIVSAHEKPYEAWRVSMEIASGPHEGKSFTVNYDRYERMDKHYLLTAAGVASLSELPGQVVDIRLPGQISTEWACLTPFYVRVEETL